MNEIVLQGCTPEPLMSYLKSLGIFRIIAQQKDPDARSLWKQDTFTIHSSIVDQEKIQKFFLDEYQPTPIVAPWNGGSGFFTGDNKKAIELISNSNSPRFTKYRMVITKVKEVLNINEIKKKPDKEIKKQLLEKYRKGFPDFALDWLDAVYVLTSENPKFPPILGTGGNDGRLDFTQNFMQQLLKIIPVYENAEVDNSNLKKNSQDWLGLSIFDRGSPKLIQDAAIGQYNPGGSGGANMDRGFNASSLVNPWDYILMMEGAIVFAGSVARKISTDSREKAIYPFTVSSSSVGYATAVESEETSLSRAEIWVPIWERSISISELQHLFSEGRAQFGKYQAKTGLQFVRAISSLGVD
ncbi:MAG: type I-U CRISPR-associated protein Csx17, partial [Candidatus Schekmanbacteria bacterium RBG_13_48_7]